MRRLGRSRTAHVGPSSTLRATHPRRLERAVVPGPPRAGRVAPHCTDHCIIVQAGCVSLFVRLLLFLLLFCTPSHGGRGGAGGAAGGCVQD
jgi:hypothetical protein